MDEIAAQHGVSLSPAKYYNEKFKRRGSSRPQARYFELIFATSEAHALAYKEKTHA